MQICVLKEKRPQENRVAASPETVKKLIAKGFKVNIESGAGVQSNFTDHSYKESGATICKTAAEALKGSEIILKVRRPMTKEEGEDEISSLPENSYLISTLDALTEKEQLKIYTQKKIKAFALELVPRITRAQSMDVLSSQSSLAGYRAVIEAAHELPSAFPMMMTAAGTIAPMKVLILGAGVAGLQAIATAKRLGAIVSVFDVRKAAKEQVESLKATFIEVEGDENSETTGGYAKEMSKDYQKRQADKIHETLQKSDIAITTALIPGKPAPRLITDQMLKDMKEGSIVVDMATSAGGNVEGSEPDKIVTKHGVKIIGYSNLAGRISNDSSALYSRNVLKFLEHMIDENGKIKLDQEDEIIKSTLVS